MILTLSNDHLRLSVRTLGAEMVSLVDLRSGVECLCPREKPVWQEQAPLLFPIQGKLWQDSYLHQGRRYRMETHGFGRHREFTVRDQGRDHLELELRSDPGTLEQYPFPFRLRLRYQLEQATVTITSVMENTGEEPLVYAIGFHPGFRLLPGETGCCLEFEPALTATRAVMEGFRIHHLQKEAFRQVRQIPVTEEFFSGGAVTLTDLSCRRVTLRCPGRYVTVDLGDHPQLALWTLENRPVEYVCIEPRSGLQDLVEGDGLLVHKAGMIPVEPGEADTRCFSITLG